MRARLLSLVAAAVLALGCVPAAAQGVEPDVVCLTNAVPVPTLESRIFCEPLDSVGFVQFEQFVDGVEELAAAYPDFVEVKQIGTSVQGRPILFVELTNEKSTVPRAQKLQLGYSASIHANEAAGREGMTRVIEDLAAGIGPYGADLKPRLDNIILNVWFPNPDSWAGGDFFSREDILGVHAGAGFARANANGYDLNRQFPNPGWILPDHDPMSQPEARAVVSELRYSGNHTNLVAGADLHGMLASQNMVRSIIPNQDYDFRRMVLVVEQLREMQDRIDNNPSFTEWNAVATAGGTFEEATGIREVTATVRDAADVPCVSDPLSGIPITCVSGPTDVIGKPFLWGARWDQIGYTDTGFTSDYMTLSPRSPTGGMGAVGQIVEFAYSHQVPDNKYVAKLTDMHVAGVREIVRTQMEQATRLDSPVLAGTGPVGYVWAPDWVSSDDDLKLYGYDYPNATWTKPEFDLGSEEGRFDFRQVAYNVSNLVFWRDLGRFAADPFTPIEPGAITADSLGPLAHLTITDQAIDALSAGEIATIKSWVEGGGHLLLTDGALRFFDFADLGEAGKLCTYLGYTDLQTRDHALLADVDWNARTTGEASAIGIGATEGGGDEYPSWGLLPGTTAALGGDLVGTTGSLEVLGGGDRRVQAYVHGDHAHGPSEASAAAPNDQTCEPSTTGQLESLGRVPLGQGSIDFLGAALPRPTQAYDHRYGLADYSVSALTYWVVMNSLGGHVEHQPIDTPFIPTYDFDPIYGSAAVDAGEAPEGGKDTPGLGPVVLLAALGAALVVGRRRD